MDYCFYIWFGVWARFARSGSFFRLATFLRLAIFPRLGMFFRVAMLALRLVKLVFSRMKNEVILLGTVYGVW